LERLTANDVEVQRLQQQVGIGPVTAWTIRAEIGHFDRFLRKHVSNHKAFDAISGFGL
jgi:transposase